FFLGLPLVSQASELRLLIDMLHENGMVSEEQYGRLLAELEQNQQKLLIRKTRRSICLIGEAVRIVSYAKSRIL
ncbi:hypothetical protein C9940_05915, partial [Pseudidiomarina aestuarii]